jgi:toxin CcdB
MAQYDVYPAPDGAGYLLDVQTDWLAGFNTRLVVPLLPPDVAPEPGRVLNPTFDVEEKPHRMVTQFLAAVPETWLRAPVGNVSGRAEEVTRALDLILHGF